MKRTFLFFTTLTVMAFVMSADVFAGTLSSVKSWISGEVLAFLGSAVLALAGGASALIYQKVVRTFRETGEFLQTLGAALEDKRLTKDELAQIIRDGKEVFTVWK